MIPFSPPRIDQKTINSVVDTLHSGWITTGPKTKEFERQLAIYTGAQKVFCVNAATNGTELLLRWLGVGPGDEVIVPAYTYCATANVVLHCGATVVMADVLDDFTIDPASVEKLITERTKAIVPVDLGGLPAHYDALKALIEKHQSRFSANTKVQEQLGRIALVVDSAHSVGAEYKGQKLGTQADAMVFSFHAVKNLTTAEGGAVCLNLPAGFDHDAAYAWLNKMSLHGQSKDALAKMQRGAWEYDVTDAGYKCNMTDLQAAIGLVELERYESETLPKRKTIVAAYNQAFAEKSWAIVPLSEDEHRTSSYHLYLLRVKGITLAQRNLIIERIFEKDVSVNVHYKPLPELTVYKELGFDIEAYPVSKAHWHSEISLPIFFDLTPEMQDTVVAAVIESVESVLK